MFRVRATRRAPKVLLLLTVAATAVVFLAPTAQADSGLGIVTNSPTDLSTVSPGDTIVYSFTVTNAGPDDATAVVLSDSPPGDTTYVTNSATIGGADVPGDENPGDPNPFLAGVALGAPLAVSDSVTFGFSAVVNSPLADGTQLVNTASALDTDDIDPATTSQVTQTVNSAPSLSVNKTASPAEGGSVAPGDTITYTVVVGNSASATDTATGVSVADPVPADTTYVADSATEDGNPVAGATNPFESGYTLTDSTLDPGETHTLTYQVDVDSPLPNGTVLSNTATASAANAADAADSATHTVASAPGLAVDKTASPAEGGSVAPGDTLTYSIVVSNDPLATDTATNVVLTDATPAGTTYVADSATVDTVQVTGATNPFEAGYPLPNMAPGASHTVTFDVVVDSPLDNGTSIDNTATLDSDQGSATDDATHTVASQSTLTLEKTSSPAEGGPVTPGTTVTYSIVVTNDAAANENADQLVLTDPTPTGTTYVADSATLDGAPVTGADNPFETGYDLPDLAPGESATVTYDVTVNSPLANGTVVSNMAALTADNHPDLSDEATHTVDSAPVMKVEITAVPAAGAEVKSGDRIDYSVVITNDAAATETLTGVAVSVTPPVGTTYVPPSGESTPSSPAPRAAETASADGTVVLTDPHELVNYIWWLMAHSQNPTEYIATSLGTAIALDEQLLASGGVTPYSILLATMTKQQLVAFGAAHPEASMVIDATLAKYEELRPPVLYMLGHYRVDLGLANASEVPYVEGSEYVLRGDLQLGDAIYTDAASAAQAPSEATAAQSLADLAPGQSTTTAFSVNVGSLAAGTLTTTTSVSATNHPTVVATTTHTVPSADDGDGGGNGNGNDGGRAFGDDGSSGGTTTTLDSGAAAAGESLAFTGLDLAKLVLLAMSLLLAGWVLLVRGQMAQRRAVVFSGRHPAYEAPTGRYAPRTWFFQPER